MTEKEKLYRGTSQAAWGYLFLYVDINLGTVSILPAFVGFLLFLSAIRYLSDQRRDLALLRPLGALLGAYHGVDWALSWLGITISGRFALLDLVVGAASLYFHFQFLTDCAALAAAYQGPEDALDRRLLRWRTVQTILITALALSLRLTQLWNETWSQAAALVLAVAGFCVTICLMAAMFALRRLFAKGTENSQSV